MKDTEPTNNHNINHLTREDKILILIDQKADLSEDIAKVVIEEPKLLETIIDGVSSETARVKFRCAKILKMISEKQPEILISKWDFFINLLDSDNKIILWNALDIIANLTSADQKHRFDGIYQRYYQFLEDESMITAAHVVDNSDKIVENRPDLENKITKKLLNIKTTPRDGECHDILSGKVILVLEKYYDTIKDKEEVIAFTKEQSESQRNATKIKAQKFLKKHSN